jgi:hypothetical protein
MTLYLAGGVGSDRLLVLCKRGRVLDGGVVKIVKVFLADGN